MKFFISKQFKFNINISKHIKLPQLALSLLAIFSLAFLPTLSIVQQVNAINADAKFVYEYNSRVDKYNSCLEDLSFKANNNQVEQSKYTKLQSLSPIQKLVNILTTATIGDNKFSYDYNQQTTSDCNQASANLLAYKNSNRTKFKHVTLNTDGSTKDVIKDSSYCYNNADQLIASTNDNALDSPTYDSHGNTLTLGSGVNQTSLTYDSSDRNIGVIEAGGAVTTTSTTNADGTVTTTTTTAPKKEVSYVRDLQNRLLSRVTKTNDIETSNSNYGYTASGDSPDFITDTNNNVVEKYLSLAGGVLLTIRPNTNASTSVELANISTYSLANIHGDIFATLDSNGALRNKTMTGAYGEKLSLPTGAALTSALANPNSLASKLTVSYVSGANTNIVTNGTNNNNVVEATNGYVGQHQKLTESNLAIGLIQMGARVYLPTIGRFLQVDPVEGGNDNSYVYVVDPVNEFDLDGNFGMPKVLKSAIKVATKVAAVASFIPGPIGMVASGIACAGYLAQGQYGKAAEMAVGMIPGGKVIGKASKVAKGLKNADKAMDTAKGSSKIARVLAKGNFSRKLENGAIRSYGEFKAARTSGEMLGARKVTELAKGGKIRKWYETIDQTGRVRSVRPFDGKGYRHYIFDKLGKFGGVR